MKKNAHYIHTTMNLVNIICGIFIMDHACETMHKADKTGAPKQEFAFRANTTACWPTVGGGVIMFFSFLSNFLACQDVEEEKEALYTHLCVCV